MLPKGIKIVHADPEQVVVAVGEKTKEKEVTTEETKEELGEVTN